MFDPKILARLAASYQKPMKKLAAIEKELNNRFTELTEPIRALILSVAASEPLLLIGPPGTAKSRLIRAFCGLIGLLHENDPGRDHPDYFEYLLTPFTEPGELFGYYDISEARKGRLVRVDIGMMQHAQVVYLDEVFNGSSAILNSILAFMNERIFHDRGERKRVKMNCLFGATNRIPETPELRAIFDRFVLRCRIENIDAKPGAVSKLLEKGWQETYTARKQVLDGQDLLQELDNFRKAINTYTEKGELLPQTETPIHNRLAQWIHYARLYDLSEMSNRRLVKMVHIMLVHRVYEAAISQKPGSEISLRNKELQLMYRYFLDRADEESVQKMERTLKQ
ncbi:MAG: MoxR family ATPase [Desulfobacteraceae bacterium]|nr:MoxR family ATPase [Desulfobacteraceae bacterium]